MAKRKSGSGPGGPGGPEKGGSGGPGKVELPSEEELAKLPRRAMIAFAGRCARRVQPLFKHFWPDAAQDDTKAIGAAVSLVESVGAGAPRTRAGYRASYAAAHIANATNIDAANVANTAADAANAVGSQAPAGSIARAAEQASAAIDALDRARSTQGGLAYVAGTYPEGTFPAGAHPISGHFGVAARAVMRRDYELLKAAAEREQWTDETPVPPEFFGPLWPDGEPDGWPADEKKRERRRKMVLQVAVPEDTPDEELDATVAALIEAASRMHAAHGGSGLLVNDKRVYNPADVPVEVDS